MTRILSHNWNMDNTSSASIRGIHCERCSSAEVTPIRMPLFPLSLESQKVQHIWDGVFPSEQIWLFLSMVETFNNTGSPI